MNKSTDAVTKPAKAAVDERIVAQITSMLRAPNVGNQGSAAVPSTTPPSMPVPASNVR